jgi:hypothetical protein
MDWQIVTVVLIVAAAVLYLGRAGWRVWSGAKGSCGGSCGCGRAGAAGKETVATPTIIPADQLRLRRRDSG